MDQCLLRMGRLEECVAARGDLAEAAAERQHEVGIVEPAGDRLVHRHAENADVARRAVVDEVLAAKRARHRKFVRLAERLDIAARLGGPAALAHDDERALGAGEQVPQPLEILSLGHDRLGLERIGIGGGGLLGEDVLREREHDRPGPAGQRDRERLGHVLGNAVDGIDLPCRFRDTPEHVAVVELLPRFAPTKRPRHLADEEEHRRGVLLRRVDADSGLGRARAAGDEADPGSAGELPVRLRRVRRALLVTARDQADRRVVQRVEHGQVALARETEREVRAVQLELVDEDPAAGPQSGTSRRTVAR